MEIYRFSNDAFNPQYQKHHYEGIYNFYFDEDYFKELLSDSNDRIRHFIERQKEEKKQFYEENINDLKYGIWAFTSKHFRRRSLNHLKTLPKMFSAEIPEDTVVFDVNLREKRIISDPILESFGCYIPEKELYRIKNIKQVNFKYEGKPYSDFYKRREA